MADQVTDQLRKLAVELVRSGRASDASALLAGIGALEMLSMFADNGQARPSEHATNGQQQDPWHE